jgi:hypothetical protein
MLAQLIINQKNIKGKGKYPDITLSARHKRISLCVREWGNDEHDES